MLIQNAIRVHEDGVILKSCHRHDFVIHETPSGKRWLLDGGLDYERLSVPGIECFTSLHLYDNSSDDDIDDKLAWGTHGKSLGSNEPRRWVLLRDCDDDHLKKILDIQVRSYGNSVLYLGRLYRDCIARILKKRSQ